MTTPYWWALTGLLVGVFAWGLCATLLVVVRCWSHLVDMFVGVTEEDTP